MKPDQPRHSLERRIAVEEKLLKITDSLSIHVPADYTPEQEARVIAMLRDDLEHPERMEAELKELLRLEEEGKLLDFEEVLDDLERKWDAKAGETR
jgi:hypothetical protein